MLLIKNRIAHFVLVFTVFILQSYVNAESSKKDFYIYDALIYKNKPDTSEYGIKKVTLLNHVHLLNDEHTKLNDRIDNYFELADINNLLVVNVEHWPLKNNKDMSKNIPRYQSVIKYVKNKYPEKSIGIYSMFPERNYWASLAGHNSNRYKAWMTKNDMLNHIVSDADIIMPSLYTFYTDKNGWVKFAEEIIKEARRNNPNKKIYAFIWPQYHVSNWLRGGDYIDSEFWRLQLETVYKYADSVIIWGGWDDRNGTHLAWEDELEWWQETKKFAVELKR